MENLFGSSKIFVETLNARKVLIIKKKKKLAANLNWPKLDDRQWNHRFRESYSEGRSHCIHFPFAKNKKNMFELKYWRRTIWLLLLIFLFLINCVLLSFTSLVGFVILIDDLADWLSCVRWPWISKDARWEHYVRRPHTVFIVAKT